MTTSLQRFLFLAIFSLAFVTQSSFGSIVVTDDFSTNTVGVESRLRLEDEDEQWIRFSTSLWNVSGGTLNNPGTTAAIPAEGAVLRVVDTNDIALSTATEITFSFDYVVGTGSTLYFHGTGLSGGTILAGNTQLHNTGAQNGNIQSQYDDAGGNNGSAGDFTGINLGNGAVAPNGGSGGALSGGLTGTGTFTQTIDISQFTGITDISDFQFLTFGFASNVTDNTGAGAISIDNFEFSVAEAVPEPTSAIALLGLFSALAVRRRRS